MFSLNSGRYFYPEVDLLLTEVAGLNYFADQTLVFDRIQQLIVADQPYPFFDENVRLGAINTRIQ